jgi:transcriptional regulator with XRE-family HTH domain
MRAIHEDWIGEHMISRTQVRQARAILGWSVRDLAMRAFVSIAAVNLIEAADPLPSENSRQLSAVRATFEAAGIEFLEGDATARRNSVSSCNRRSEPEEKL